MGGLGRDNADAWRAWRRGGGGRARPCASGCGGPGSCKPLLVHLRDKTGCYKLTAQMLMPNNNWICLRLEGCKAMDLLPRRASSSPGWRLQSMPHLYHTCSRPHCGIAGYAIGVKHLGEITSIKATKHSSLLQFDSWLQLHVIVGARERAAAPVR